LISAAPNAREDRRAEVGHFPETPSNIVGFQAGHLVANTIALTQRLQLRGHDKVCQRASSRFPCRLAHVMDSFADGAEDRPHAFKHPHAFPPTNTHSPPVCRFVLRLAEQRGHPGKSTPFLGISRCLPSNSFPDAPSVKSSVICPRRTEDKHARRGQKPLHPIAWSVAETVHDHFGVFHRGQAISDAALCGTIFEEWLALIGIAASRWSTGNPFRSKSGLAISTAHDTPSR